MVAIRLHRHRIHQGLAVDEAIHVVVLERLRQQ
jgi:hypothetical protein